MANASGKFSTTISPPTLAAGEHQLKASCGPTLTATLAMVVPSSNSPAESSSAIFAVFIILGLILLRGQYNSNSTRRRRRSRKGEFEIDPAVG
jgi:hypothetical protein